VLVSGLSKLKEPSRRGQEWLLLGDEGTSWRDSMGESSCGEVGGAIAIADTSSLLLLEAGCCELNGGASDGLWQAAVTVDFLQLANVGRGTLNMTMNCWFVDTQSLCCSCLSLQCLIVAYKYLGTIPF